jgi:hypothetical protein
MFTLFSWLPVEIRLLVWKHALPGPRTVTISSNDICINLSPGKLFTCFVATHNADIVPTILHASKESRAVAKKYYELAFGIRLSNYLSGKGEKRSGGIWFDFDRDILLMQD